jgi:hypothetical protein
MTLRERLLSYPPPATKTAQQEMLIGHFIFKVYSARFPILF